MYLKHFTAHNISSIEKCDVELKFNSDLPKPLLLVGKNGSGKTTFISYIVNSILSMKNIVFENSEIVPGKVFRVRCPDNIRNNEFYSYVSVEFSDNIRFIEWQLSSMKSLLDDDQIKLLKGIDKNIDKLKDFENNYFTSEGTLNKQAIEKIFRNNVLIYFPADRFERSDWQNSIDLSEGLKLPHYEHISGTTCNQFISMTRLKILSEWILGLILDIYLRGFQSKTINDKDKSTIAISLNQNSEENYLWNSVVHVLHIIFCNNNQGLSVYISDRRNIKITLIIFENNIPIRIIKNFNNISSGEASLLCIFLSIIQYYDLSYYKFNGCENIKGIVLIDEIDLHLHQDALYNKLPSLMCLFKKVQFIISLHSPVALLGIEDKYGSGNIQILEMPFGNEIISERYSEFKQAYNIFSLTETFRNEINSNISKTSIPTIFTEGQSDVTILSTAWKKLFPDDDLPFNIRSSGGEDKHNNGARRLNQAACTLGPYLQSGFLALFDYDNEGYAQYNGIKTYTCINENIKQYENKLCFAMLLPTPQNRLKYTNGDCKYLSIEHYFSDSILKKQGLINKEAIPGSHVYSITSSSNKKIRFSQFISTLHKRSFKNFINLFEIICNNFGIQLPN